MEKIFFQHPVTFKLARRTFEILCLPLYCFVYVDSLFNFGHNLMTLIVTYIV